MFSLVSPGRRARTCRTVLLPLLTVLALTGCANRDEPSAGSPESTGLPAAYPMRITPPGGEPITLPARPERIVSLSASTTEVLFAVGAGKQVVAVDEQSTFPADAPKTALSGLNPNIESIAGYDADLVIAQGDANDLVAGMAKLGRPVLILPSATTVHDALEQMRLVGQATGHEAEGADLARRTQEEIDKIVADTPKPPAPLSYYHELDTELFSVTSKTFIGQIYAMFGMVNIADPADTDSGGYPKLSAEHILQSDPDLIFLADTRCCGQTTSTVTQRAGWSNITAVREGNVVELDDDLASRWGPRIVDLVRAVAAAVGKASGQGG